MSHKTLLGVWAHRQTMDADNWVDTSSRLLSGDQDSRDTGYRRS